MSEAAIQASIDSQPVEFQHEFFKSFPEVYFRKTEDGDVVAVVQLSPTNEAVMSLDSIRTQFNIPADSPDSKMLNKVAESLHYVNGIAMGEELPPELTTGEPSWQPTDRHILIARQRLTLQLVTWVTGDEHIFTSVEQLLMLAEDPRTKKNIARAFGDAAVQLGLQREDHEAVIIQIETIAKQLSYVEAMRDIFEAVKGIDDKVQEFRKIYGSDQIMSDTSNQVAKLSQICIKEFEQMFDQVDAQTSEVMAILKNIANQINFIRKTRDDLYRRLRPWEGICLKWKSVYTIKDNENAEKLRALYRFLAPRYMVVHDWVLMSKLKMEKSKPIGGTLRW